MEIVLALEIWKAERQAPDSTERNRLMDYGAFAAMSRVSAFPEGNFTPPAQLHRLKWENARETGIRCLVRVKLPDGIKVDHYPVEGVQTLSLGGEYDAHDGMGKIAYVFVTSPAMVDGDNYESAFDLAIQNGIQLSVPKQGGGRESVSIPVLERSPVFRAHHDPYPAGWQ